MINARLLLGNYNSQNKLAPRKTSVSENVPFTCEEPEPNDRAGLRNPDAPRHEGLLSEHGVGTDPFLRPDAIHTHLTSTGGVAVSRQRLAGRVFIFGKHRCLTVGEYSVGVKHTDRQTDRQRLTAEPKQHPTYIWWQLGLGFALPHTISLRSRRRPSGDEAGRHRGQGIQCPGCAAAVGPGSGSAVVASLV